MDVVKELGRTIPVLGVCLGHQAICAAYGADVTYAKKLMHGKQSEVRLDTDSPLFQNCTGRTAVARYHSLAVDSGTKPELLKPQLIRMTVKSWPSSIRNTPFSAYSSIRNRL